MDIALTLARRLPREPLKVDAGARTDPLPEVVVGTAQADQPLLPLATDGVLRWVWQSRFGAMLIEVVGDDVLVNGQRVEPHAS